MARHGGIRRHSRKCGLKYPAQPAALSAVISGHERSFPVHAIPSAYQRPPRLSWEFRRS